jgi:hypothetical protein
MLPIGGRDLRTVDNAFDLSLDTRAAPDAARWDVA